MRQLNEKEIKCHSDNSTQLAKLKIFSDQLSKMEQMKEDLVQKEKLILDLQKLVNSEAQSKPKPMTPVSQIMIKILLYFI